MKAMFSIRKILFTVLLISLTGGCSAIFGSYEGDEPARYTELRFEDQKPIKLKVSKVDVISEFTPSFRRPNVEHLFPISIEKTAKTWARDRLEAVDFSSDKVAQFIIKDASVTEELETTDKVFERDRMEIPCNAECCHPHQRPAETIQRRNRNPGLARTDYSRRHRYCRKGKILERHGDQTV